MGQAEGRTRMEGVLRLQAKLGERYAKLQAELRVNGGWGGGGVGMQTINAIKINTCETLY